MKTRTHRALAAHSLENIPLLNIDNIINNWGLPGASGNQNVRKSNKGDEGFQGIQRNDLDKENHEVISRGIDSGEGRVNQALCQNAQNNDENYQINSEESDHNDDQVNDRIVNHRIPIDIEMNEDHNLNNNYSSGGREEGSSNEYDGDNSESDDAL